jgi:hypothetical protein
LKPFYQKTLAFESPYRDRGGRDGRVHDGVDRPARAAAIALRVCRRRCLEVHDIRQEREWRDLSMRKLALKLRYRPGRVACPRCGVRVEDFPLAEPWAGDHGAVQCSCRAGAGIELARNGAPVRAELEGCGDDREARRLPACYRKIAQLVAKERWAHALSGKSRRKHSSASGAPPMAIQSPHCPPWCSGPGRNARPIHWSMRSRSTW